MWRCRGGLKSHCLRKKALNQIAHNSYKLEIALLLNNLEIVRENPNKVGYHSLKVYLTVHVTKEKVIRNLVDLETTPRHIHPIDRIMHPDREDRQEKHRLTCDC